MSTDVTGCHPPDCNWEQRQKHASFFQNQIGFVQQAALAAIASATVLLTIAFTAAKFFSIPPEREGVVVMFGMLSWLLCSGLTAISFSRSACRIRDDYLAEHAIIFPGSTPYSLESYLFDFAEKNPFLVRRKTGQPPSKKD